MLRARGLLCKKFPEPVGCGYLKRGFFIYWKTEEN